MFRKAGSPSADSGPGSGAAGGAAPRRTWAEMRARLNGRRAADAEANGSGGTAAATPSPAPSDAERRPRAPAVPAGGLRRPVEAPAVAMPADARATTSPEPKKIEPAVAAAPPPVDPPAKPASPCAPGTDGRAAEAPAPEARARPAPDGSAAAEPVVARSGQDAPGERNEVRAAPAADAARRVATGAAAARPEPRAEDAPRQPAAPGRLLGRVISVTGSLVWGVLEPDVADLAEIGAVVRLHNGRGRSVGLITTLRNDGRRRREDDLRLVEIRLIGEILDAGPAQDRFQRGVSSYPPLDSEIHAANPADLEAMYSPPATATVRLGTLSHTSGLPAFAITDNLLGKHFAVLGSTGAGKSCAVTVILRAILDANPYGHVVMLDPHNEYGRAFEGRAELLNPSNLKLPYWLLSYEELASILVSRDAENAYAEAVILKEALLAARRGFVGAERDAEHITVDTPIPYRLSDLVRTIKDGMGGFNRAENTAAYQHLIARIESITGDKRYAFMFSSFLVQDNMHQVLARILRIPVQEKPITIIDISGVPSEIVDVVVSVLFRLIFEFALWSERAKAPPILLVCEEAHRYVPGDDLAGFAPTKRSISRIAKEGRKYGLGLCLATQRPSELATSSLSQCNTIFALRLSNERDLEFVRNAVTDSSRWLTDALPALNTQEAVVVGDGVTVPMHIRFDELDPETRPASTTPRFSQVWQEEVEGEGLIGETIERWRHQTRREPSA